MLNQERSSSLKAWIMILFLPKVAAKGDIISIEPKAEVNHNIVLGLELP